MTELSSQTWKQHVGAADSFRKGIKGAGELKLKPTLDYHPTKPRAVKGFVNAQPPTV
jgi:hypothetical protein